MTDAGDDRVNEKGGGALGNRRITAVAALTLLLLVPNLPLLASWAAFKVKSASTLQEIKQIVEEPESLLIQSEVWEDDFVHSHYHMNSFTLNTRVLDAGLLKALAIQTPGGAVHLFRPGAEPFYAASDRCDRERRAMSEFGKRLKEEAEAASREGRDSAALKALAEKAGDLTRRKRQRCDEIENADSRAARNSAEFFESVAELPSMRYRVHIWQKDKYILLWRLYRVRQLDIYDNQSGERIAWAQTYYRDKWGLTNFKEFVNNLGPYPAVLYDCVQLEQGVELGKFASKVLFEKTRQRKQAEQAAGEPR